MFIPLEHAMNMYGAELSWTEQSKPSKTIVLNKCNISNTWITIRINKFQVISWTNHGLCSLIDDYDIFLVFLVFIAIMCALLYIVWCIYIYSNAKILEHRDYRERETAVIFSVFSFKPSQGTWNMEPTCNQATTTSKPRKHNTVSIRERVTCLFSAPMTCSTKP